MTMQAIKVAPENKELILNSVDGISEEDVAVMMEFVNHHERYFIDQLSDAGGGWHTVPADIFAAAFKFDQDKIETGFVEITRK